MEMSSKYEQERLARIQQNKERLQSLQACARCPFVHHLLLAFPAPPPLVAGW